MSSATVATAGPNPTSPRQSLWILNPGWDLVLFVATPLLILPGMYLARSRWSMEEIALFIASFGALGHHLPGMIRAYGDRALFERFKVRFIVAPIFLAAVCILFTVRDLSSILLAVYAWGVWHGMMQTYGFLRIYDAKVKSFSQLTARLDWLLCAAWFGAGVLLSKTRLVNLLDTFYKAGGPTIPAQILEALRFTALAGVVAITALWLVHTLRMWKLGSPPSPIKLVLIVTSFGFWWYANVTVQEMLVGVALFEIFHDVQYLSIVWLYNQKRAATAGGQLTNFARFLFRRSGTLVGLYVGLVFAYGSLNYVAVGLDELVTLKRVLMGLLLASALLHFYYDGFIWKVREKSTRESLGLEGGGTASGTPGWVIHGARWSLFVVPLLALGVLEVKGASMPDLDRQEALAEALPEFAFVRYNLGVQLAEEGESERAMAEYRRALAIDPAMANAHHNLGNLLSVQGRYDEAITHFREALRLEPKAAESRGALGNALLARGRLDEAVAELEVALGDAPGDATLHTNLANALAAGGETERALELHRRAVALEPDSALARYNLGQFLAARGDDEAAVSEYREATTLDPELALAQYNLGNALARLGHHEEAVEHFRQAALVAPDAETQFNLGNSLLALERLGEASDAYRGALTLRPDFAQAVHNLGVVAHLQGDSSAALDFFRRAVELAPDYADAHRNLGLLLSRQGDEERAQYHLELARRLSSG